jgi:hypothetical protein
MLPVIMTVQAKEINMEEWKAFGQSSVFEYSPIVADGVENPDD